MACVVLGGCDSLAERRAATPTGGFAMEMFVRDETGAEEYYEVRRDGTIGFGGGMDARLRRVSWSAPLSEDQIARLQELIDEHGWYDRRPRTEGPRERSYRIDLHGPRGQKRLRVSGASPDIEPVRAMLNEITLARLEDDLQRLPKPSIEAREDPRP